MTQVAPPTTPTTGISTDTSRLTLRANLDKAGTQFEAVFTRMMLTSMRKTRLAEPLFDSKAIDTFRDMQDGLVAESMAQHAPMGIGRAVTQFLEKALPKEPDLNETAAPPTP